MNNKLNDFGYKKVLLLLLFVLFLNLFFFHFFGNLAFVLFSIASFKFIFFTFVSPFNFRKFITYFLPLLLLCVTLLIRSNGFVILIAVLSILTYLTACVYLFSRKIDYFSSWLEFLFSPLRLFITYLQSLPYAFGLIKNIQNHTPSKNQKIATIIKGVILSIPVLVILISLLTNADPIYGKFINNLFNIKIDWAQETVQRIVYSGFLILFLLPFCSFRKSEQKTFDISLPKPFSLVSELSVVMFFVALILLSFLIVQFPYIFISVTKETSLSQFGVKTFSEYVRKGFFELLFAAFFIYGLVLGGLFILRNSFDLKSKKILNYLQLTVLFELLIFIFSLFRRIYLYQSFHGWSLVRIYGGVFLIGLTGFTITLILRHIVVKRWVLKESVFAFLIVLFMGFFNAEQFIATTSYPPTVNNHVDFIYLSRLSPDGYLGWKKAYSYAYDVLVTRKLQDKSLINKEERREVMYANRIIRELSDNYNELIWQFGTRDEINRYISLLIPLEKEEAEQITVKDQYYTNTLNSIKEMEKIFQSDKQKQYIHLRTSVYTYGTEEYSPELIPHQWNVFSIYTYKNIEKAKYPDTIDQFLIWNNPSFLAYTLLRDEIGLSNLISLQKKYTELYSKIANQPTDERKFDIDRSFSSPFID